MITKFDSLFAGHVDMDDVGYAGAAVNDRSFSDEHLTTVFDKPKLSPQRWTGWATTPSGWRSTTSNRKGMSASPTY